MLPKKFRITLTEFHGNKNKVVKFILPRLVFFVKKSNNKYPRFVISVVKSLDKRSVYRHRTKRIIVEALRGYLAKIPPEIEVLVKARRIIDKNERNEIEKEISKLTAYN